MMYHLLLQNSVFENVLQQNTKGAATDFASQASLLCTHELHVALFLVARSGYIILLQRVSLE